MRKWAETCGTYRASFHERRRGTFRRARWLINARPRLGLCAVANLGWPGWAMPCLPPRSICELLWSCGIPFFSNHCVSCVHCHKHLYTLGTSWEILAKMFWSNVINKAKARVSALVSINEVNLRRARLVLGWVTLSWFNSRCGTFI